MPTMNVIWQQCRCGQWIQYIGVDTCHNCTFIDYKYTPPSEWRRTEPLKPDFAVRMQYGTFYKTLFGNYE